MFKALQEICKKLNSIINAFWWGYDPDKKKLQLINWDTLTTPKNLGELGIKKFGLMNKALITKQYWRICNNPDSFLVKTLKSKYCPQEDVHTHIPKKNTPLGFGELSWAKTTKFYLLGFGELEKGTIYR